ncbi:retrotransposon protein, putative, ty1-copia subclass [Tanacetum coccineum]
MVELLGGNVHTFKARLVAKGYTLTYDIDYRETFSPIAYTRAIRILLAIAAFYDYEIWQMDVKTAFLNGHLSEDVYMVQPEGFVNPKHPSKACKLQRSIYELKQASRSWNKRFDKEIKKIDFTQNPDEPYVYLEASGSNVTFLVLYIDDILIMGNNVTMLQDVKSWLCDCFSMKDLGEITYILGIKITCDRSKRLIALSQKTPSEVKHMQRVPYALAIGSIMYAVRCTRPDVAFAQNLCSQFQQNPVEAHQTAVKTILKYLRNTKDMVLFYGENPEAKMKSVKQSTIAMSFIKAEYIAAVEASMKAVWIKKFIDGLGNTVPTNKRPIEILCDNMPAIEITNDPGIMRGARHNQKKYHYNRKVVQNGEIVLKKVHTDDNLVDPFIKQMPYNKHFEHSMAIDVCPASSLM